MGYRSDGWLYLSDKALNVIREAKGDKKFIERFLGELEKHETRANVWTFEYWKWYEGYPDVSKLNKLLDKLGERELYDEYDLLIVGEDNVMDTDYHTETAFRAHVDIIIDDNLTNMTA